MNNVISDNRRWYFTKEEIYNSPSRRAGLEYEKELSYRQQGAALIQEMGQRLRVGQLVINTAIVYMHRFYMQHTFFKFHRNTISPAAIFLAAKVEEQPRKLEHLITTAHTCINGSQATLDPNSDAYQEKAHEIVINENILLQTLGFDVAIDHPHTHVVKCCQLVRATKDLAQTSYFMATNSLHLTTMCLQYKPTVVACLCIYLVCKWSRCEIQRQSEGHEWFFYVDREVTTELLESMCHDFLKILDKCPLKVKKLVKAPSGNCRLNPSHAIGPSQLDHGHRQANSSGGPSRAPLSSSSSVNTSMNTSNMPPAAPPQSRPALNIKEYNEKREKERKERERVAAASANTAASSMLGQQQQSLGSRTSNVGASASTGSSGSSSLLHHSTQSSIPHNAAPNSSSVQQPQRHHHHHSNQQPAYQPLTKHSSSSSRSMSSSSHSASSNALTHHSSSQQSQRSSAGHDQQHTEQQQLRWMQHQQERSSNKHSSNSASADNLHQYLNDQQSNRHQILPDSTTHSRKAESSSRSMYHQSSSSKLGHEMKVEAKAEVKSEQKGDVKPEFKMEIKPDPRIDVKQEFKMDFKQEGKLEKGMSASKSEMKEDVTNKFIFTNSDSTDFNLRDFLPSLGDAPPEDIFDNPNTDNASYLAPQTHHRGLSPQSSNPSFTPPLPQQKQSYTPSKSGEKAGGNQQHSAHHSSRGIPSQSSSSKIRESIKQKEMLKQEELVKQQQQEKELLKQQELHRLEVKKQEQQRQIALQKAEAKKQQEIREQEALRQQELLQQQQQEIKRQQELQRQQRELELQRQQEVERQQQELQKQELLRQQELRQQQELQKQEYLKQQEIKKQLELQAKKEAERKRKALEKEKKLLEEQQQAAALLAQSKLQEYNNDMIRKMELSNLETISSEPGKSYPDQHDSQTIEQIVSSVTNKSGSYLPQSKSSSSKKKSKDTYGVLSPGTKPHRPQPDSPSHPSQVAKMHKSSNRVVKDLNKQLLFKEALKVENTVEGVPDSAANYRDGRQLMPSSGGSSSHLSSKDQHSHHHRSSSSSHRGSIPFLMAGAESNPSVVVNKLDMPINIDTVHSSEVAGKSLEAKTSKSSLAMLDTGVGSTPHKKHKSDHHKRSKEKKKHKHKEKDRHKEHKEHRKDKKHKKNKDKDREREKIPSPTLINQTATPPLKMTIKFKDSLVIPTTRAVEPSPIGTTPASGSGLKLIIPKSRLQQQLDEQPITASGPASALVSTPHIKNKSKESSRKRDREESPSDAMGHPSKQHRSSGHKSQVLDSSRWNP